MTGELHPEFRLNGLSCDREALLEVAYSYIKEGEAYEGPIGDFLLDWFSDSPTVLVKTSGSTGPPKNIEIAKKSMAASAKATAKFFGLRPGCKSLHCLSALHIAGKMMLVRAMVLGWSLELVSPSSSPLLEARGEYDFCAMVPLQLRNSLPYLDRIKTLIVGGAPMAGKDVIALKDAKTKIYESYGMTETASHIALKHLNGPDTEKDMAVPFNALPGIMLSQDEKGCLMIKLPWDSVQTIHTNDIVSLTDSDQFQWLGRSDNVINSGGVKLHPEMIEDKLCGLIDNRFIMMGVPDEELGQRLIMVLEGLAEESEVMTTIKEHKAIEKYEIPKEIFKMEKFPETGNGKVNRPEIHNWVLNL